MRLNRLLHLVLLSLVCTLFLVAAPADSAPAVQGADCTNLVTLATTAVGFACDGLGRNQACYGNTIVNVEFAVNSPLTFAQSGDIIGLSDIRRISTTPYNAATGAWGVAVLKAQVNLPDALPGENVTFLLFGDTTLDAVDPNLNIVRVNTNLTSTSCDNAPSGLLIQSPTGQQVTMNINGADITLSSTALLVAEPFGSMKLAMVEGLGVVTAFGETRIVPQGSEIGVRLGGGDDGLDTTGPPSGLRPYTIAVDTAPIGMLDRLINVAPPLDVTPGATAMSAGTATPAATQEGACTPRADWTARYTIQSGDTMSGIAGRAGVSLDELAQGNCIVDVRRIVAGQSLNVPFRLSTNTPTRRPVTATVTPSATVALGMIGPNLRADNMNIKIGECTNIRWDVDNIREVYFEGQGVVGHSSQQVCPYSTQTYTLRVVRLDGVTQDFQIIIYATYDNDNS